MYLELRIATCACMLAVASILDIKTREIPDKVWLIFGAAGATITISELLSGEISNDVNGGIRLYAIHYGIGMAIISTIGYLTYRAGLFGGADSKALITLALILPTYNLGFQLHSFPALSIFSNAIIISMVAMAYNVIRNSFSIARRIPIFEGIEETRMRKALAFTVGFPAQSYGKYVFAMEETNNHGQRKFRFNPASYDDFAEQNKKEKIWVTQALPFIVYISTGFLVTATLGDLMALFAKALLA